MCLNALVFAEQGGFFVGQQFFYGIVIVAEVIHSIATSKDKAMLIKLDMEKAYDRVKWSFLQKILLAFGFCTKWIDWIMSYVSSTSFSFLINGEPSNLFSTSRGLRQGDPLSPYFFITMVEGPNRFIHS